MSHISFIVCCLDNTNELSDTLKSLSMHLESGDEVLVVDGSSYSHLYNKQALDSLIGSLCITEVILCPPSGIYNAINEGLKNSHNSWINVIHAGDTVIAESLNEIRRSLRNNQTDIVICNQMYGPDIKDSSILDAAHHKKVVPHQSTFYRLSLHNDHGLYDETKRAISDQLFFRSLITESNTIYLPIIYCFFNTNGISSKFDWKIFAEEMMMKDSLSAKLFYAFKGALKLVFTVLGPNSMQRARSIKNFFVGINK